MVQHVIVRGQENQRLGKMSKVISYCSVRLPEIVNFYDFQVIFWELASKDKIYCINYSYPKGFMSHICNQLC